MTKRRGSSSRSVAKPPVIDAAQVRAAVLAKSVAAIQIKLAKGGIASKRDEEMVERYLQSQEPPKAEEPGIAPQAGEPDDLLVKTQREMSVLLGVHENTIRNWIIDGHGPSGEPPWSLKQYSTLLRRVGKLTRCKPNKAKAHAIWAWAFAGDITAAVNPDDPVHPTPIGWDEEQKRQLALQTKTQRLHAQIKLETDEGSRIPIEEIRRRTAALCLKVIATFEGVHRFLNDPEMKLTLDQRTRQNNNAAAFVRWARSEMATPP